MKSSTRLASFSMFMLPTLAQAECTIEPDSGGHVTIPDTTTLIAESAFSGCSSLLSISIPNSVTSIDAYAFSQCASLAAVDIPDSVAFIGDSAFGGCSSLTSVSIPDSVTSIGEKAFIYCFSLTWIRLPDSVTAMSRSSFPSCLGFGLGLGQAGPQGIFDFPRGTIECLTCQNISSIIIPDSVTFVGDFAFSFCMSLTSITLPRSVVSIGDAAFRGCTSLASITIPNTVTSIGDDAFNYCSSLTTIRLPDSVTSIGNFSFSGCSALTEVILSNSVAAAGDGAFSECSSLTSVAVPDSISYIGENMFRSCSALTSISIPDSVTTIRDNAFLACSSLTSVIIPDSVTSIGDGAFSRCSSIVSITIPSSLAIVNRSAFPSCLGFGLLEIQEQQFRIPHGSIECVACHNQSSVAIPDTVVSIGANAFYECASVSTLRIPDSVTFIGNSAFYGLSLTTLVLPNSLVSIGDGAFHACSALTSIIIPDSVTSIGGGTFNECTSLTSINISNSLTSISFNTFSYCLSLTAVIIPNSVMTVGLGAFFGCSSMTSVIFSNELTSFATDAFNECSSLVSISIPDSVISIGTEAFSKCTALTSAVIGDSVESISDFAFSSTALTSIRIPSNTYVAPTAFSGTFLCGGQPEGVTVVDDDYSDTSGTTEGTYSARSMVLSSFTFYQCMDLSTLSFAPTVRTIRPYAVAFSVFIDNLSIPSSVQNIERNAFVGAAHLRSIRIPPQVNVSDGAFAGCGCPGMCALFTNGSALQDCHLGYIDGSTQVWINYTTCNLATEYESQPGTFTSDFECAPLTRCSSGARVSVLPTATTDRKCASERRVLSTIDKVAIGVGGVLFLLIVALVIFRLHRQQTSTLSDLRLHEKLLHDEHVEKETLYAENIEMKRAWEIEEADLALECELARGASGTVWKARWGHIDVAVKTLRLALDDDVGGLASDEFNREVSFMQKIRHPNLLIFYGAGVTADRRAFMVVELMQHGSMRKMLLSARPLTVGQRVVMALDIARGMSHLHSLECIHRDLKSDNCLVGNDLRVKVGDFGTSRLLRTGVPPDDVSLTVLAGTTSATAVPLTHTLTGAVGTPLWMAPELLRTGSSKYGKEVDVYSYGIILWELLCRATPWEKQVPDTGAHFIGALRNAVVRGARPQIPADTDFPDHFIDLTTACWSGIAEERPTFADVVNALGALTPQVAASRLLA